MADGAKLILIAEDEAEMREVLVDRFRLADFAVLEVTNGEDGLAQIKKHRPDVVLADILMPRMDGIDMVLAVRKERWGKKLPVVFLTNLEKPPRRFEKLEKDGSISYIVKINVHLEDIVETVEEMLDR